MIKKRNSRKRQRYQATLTAPTPKISTTSLRFHWLEKNHPARGGEFQKDFFRTNP
jgi:hypothetical protein